MNWYKKAQLNKESGIKSFLGLSVISIAILLGISEFSVENKIKENPEGLAQEIRQTQEEKTHPKFEQFTTNRILEPERDTKSKEVIPEKNQSINMNLDKIVMIESSGGKNNWNSESKARGPFQFVENTWNECVKKMGKDWNWWNDSMDMDKSRQVADFYLNDRIPYMLNYYKIPDNIETRIGAYDWGIGYLRKAWDKYQDNWLEYAPTETQDYVRKYL